ncbi:hypothetical protein EVAR_60437_1 [Eumeta japonica]|uniref:Uncharacterized protein n=1 Tax=Eumeta variegata TaxID=151549 RepID=A0A4C1YZX4_EUMVA|nr:hypothetical protein EVAR_60437_1 [Eumeta japonica]
MVFHRAEMTARRYGAKVMSSVKIHVNSIGARAMCRPDKKYYIIRARLLPVTLRHCLFPANDTAHLNALVVRLGSAPARVRCGSVRTFAAITLRVTS